MAIPLKLLSILCNRPNAASMILGAFVNGKNDVNQPINPKNQAKSKVLQAALTHYLLASVVDLDPVDPYLHN